MAQRFSKGNYTKLSLSEINRERAAFCVYGMRTDNEIVVKMIGKTIPHYKITERQSNRKGPQTRRSQTQGARDGKENIRI